MRSVEGGTTRLACAANVTRPTWYCRGTRSAKRSAASCAARSRYGATSEAPIDPEVSIASMIVACSRGTSVVVFGRARPTVSAANASSARTGAKKRRQLGALPSETRRSMSGWATPGRVRLRRDHHTAADVLGMRKSRASAHGQKKLTRRPWDGAARKRHGRAVSTSRHPERQ